MRERHGFELEPEVRKRLDGLELPFGGAKSSVLVSARAQAPDSCADADADAARTERHSTIPADRWLVPIADVPSSSLMSLVWPMRDTRVGRANVRFLAGCGPGQVRRLGLLHARKDRAGYRRRAG